MKENTAIIGAGIGGLTMALALKRKDISCRVFERAPGLDPVGAGIGLGNNAMQVLHQLGVGKAVEQAGHKVSCMRITDASLRDLSLIDLTRFEKKYGVYNVAIHRGALQAILANAVGGGLISTGKKLVRIEASGGFSLQFDDNSVVETEALIGADGIRSVVRQQLFQDVPVRLAGQVCWRGVCNWHADSPYRHQAIEAWGKGRRFGLVYLDASRIYWYAVADEQLATTETGDLASLFRDFHPDVQHLISATPTANRIYGPLADLKPFKGWQRGKACLLGDAAHAATPNMGQGACQAIEDAYTIGKLIGTGATEAVFKQYEQLRIRKAHSIVKRSRSLGVIAHLHNRQLIHIRNRFMRLIPERMNARQLDPVFDISYI